MVVQLFTHPRNARISILRQMHRMFYETNYSIFKRVFILLSNLQMLAWSPMDTTCPNNRRMLMNLQCSRVRCLKIPVTAEMYPKVQIRHHCRLWLIWCYYYGEQANSYQGWTILNSFPSWYLKEQWWLAEGAWPIETIPQHGNTEKDSLSEFFPGEFFTVYHTSLERCTWRYYPLFL